MANEQTSDPNAALLKEGESLDAPASPVVAAPPPDPNAKLLKEGESLDAPASTSKVTQVRYQAPGQGTQEFTKGSTDEQQFLQRFPQAKAVSSYQRNLLPGETVSTEAPEVRSARETAEAKPVLGAAMAAPLAIGAAPIAGAMGATGLLAESIAGGLGAGAGELAGRSIAGGPTTEDVKAAGEAAAGGAATNLAIGGALRVVPKIAPFLSDVVRGYDPANLHAAITDAAKQAAPEAQVAGSVRNVLENASASVQAQSKGLYAQIDAATGGKWSANEQALRNVAMKMRDAITDEDFEDLLAKKLQFEWRQSAMLDKMADQGVPPETINAAKATYKKSMALLDVDAAVKSATVPGTETDPSIPGREVADPKKLAPRLTKLLDAGRLQDALGENGAIKLFADTKAAAIQKDAVALHRTIAGWAARGAEFAGGYELLRMLDPFAKFGGKSH